MTKRRRKKTLTVSPESTSKKKFQISYLQINLQTHQVEYYCLGKDNQLLASGTGQTSRVDALKQSIQKAGVFDFDLNGAVMASDAFFPFPDCVEIANKEGIKTVIQPGGSIKDNLSIDYCDKNEMKMFFTEFVISNINFIIFDKNCTFK